MSAIDYEDLFILTCTMYNTALINYSEKLYDRPIKDYSIRFSKDYKYYFFIKLRLFY
jgi:hypothetical protein